MDEKSRGWAGASDYFSRENLKEIADLDGQINFVAELLNKYNWHTVEKAQLYARLAALQEKQRDVRLNISVIGDFSSGKSTFINALLRIDLLEAGVLQGTTVASTVLEDGSEQKITLDCQDGKRMERHFSSFEEMRTRLNQLVADNSTAQYFSQVTVQLPAPTLARSNFRIIDTPGLNATTQWHQEVTIRTLEETSDLSVILVDATRPLPDSLVQFIQSCLQPVMEQCVFVVTKMDLISPKERAMMLEFIRQSVCARLGLENPQVLPYASLAVLALARQAESVGEESDPLLTASLESETALLRHVACQRAVAQTKKLISMTAQMYGAMACQLEKHQEDYAGQLKQIEEARQANLQEFVERQVDLRQKNFMDFYMAERGKLLQSAQLRATQAKKWIETLIAGNQGADALNQYIEQGLKKDCQREAQALVTELSQCPPIQRTRSACQEEVLAFREEFQKNFRSLPPLPPQPYQLLTEISPILEPKLSSFDQVGAYARKTIKKENALFGGGTAAGAALGTAVMPGVGTVVGALIGMFGGAAAASSAGASVQDMRQKVLQDLDNPLTRYFSDAADRVVQSMDKQSEQLKLMIQKALERYLVSYRSTVDEWIAQEQSRRQQLETLILEIQQDLEKLETRRQSLMSIQSHIRAQEVKNDESKGSGCI